MKRLLSLAYPHGRLPATLWRGEDRVLDALFHEHVNMRILVRSSSFHQYSIILIVCQSESIINKKYCRHKKGGAIEWKAAYDLDGVRDLACLERGDVASVLNADSYNAFASSTSVFVVVDVR